MQIPPEFADNRLLAEPILKQYLKSCGRAVKVYAGARLVPPDRISIGDYSQIDEDVRIFAGEGVEIKRHVHLAFGSSISGGGTLLIEDFAALGAGVRVITGTEVIDQGGLTNPTMPEQYRTVTRGRVEIQPHALIFTNSTVLPGVVIGEGAVVAAGSLVHRNLKPWAIYAGNPLVQVGVRDSAPILEKAHHLLASESDP
jgi:acetyltransferase-like isoleucine patch superfamily enzyme